MAARSASGPDLAAIRAMRAILPGLLLLAPSTARALAPDRVAWTTTELSQATDLVLAPDGLSVVMADPSAGALGVLDLRSWSVRTASTCAGSVGAAPWTVDDEVRVYTGCEDGTVTWATLSDGDLSPSGQSVDVAGGPVLGLLWLDGLLYVLTEPDDGGNPTLHVYDPDSDAVDAIDGYPSTLGHSGYQDMEENGSYLLVLHGSDNLSKVSPSTGSSVVEQAALGVLDGQDLVTQAEGTSVYGAGGAAFAWFDLSENDWSLYLDSSDGLDEVEAVCLLEEEELLVLADAGEGALLLFEYFGSTNGVGDDEVDRLAYPEGQAGVSEIVSADGFVVAGTDQGALWVMTGGPWVEVQSWTPDVATDGDTLSLVFQSDRAGDYEVRVGADDDEGGTLVASGAVEADVATTVQLVVGDDFVEGENQVRVVVDDGSGQAGHDAAVVDVDNPPSAVPLTQDGVGVGDGYLTLSFTAPGDEDLATIQVYVSTTAFAAEDWPDGGPAFDGQDDLDPDDLVFEVEPDAAVELVIAPLSNDVTYYLAARATDDGGLEGPMSTVVTGTPLETYSASELAGETGGFCGTPGAASLALGLLGLGLAGGRRRRALPALGLAVAVALAAPGAADAAEVAPEDRVMGATQLRFGPMWYDDGNIVNDVLGDSGHNVLWLETGPSWRGYAQFSLGAGFYRKKATLLTSEGTVSTQDDLLWSVPLTANLTLRLDVLQEQVLVPYLTAGGDLWLWQERWTEDAEGNKDGLGGGKWGYHYGAGGQLLLDVFDRGRAGLTFSRLGIKDSYITGEWRRQEVGVFQEGLDLSNDQVTLGLAVHY